MKALTTTLLALLIVCGCHPKDQAGDVLRQAKEYAQKGMFEQALQKHIWFHDNALQVDRSYYGVRLSFALDDWVELGRKYPKALEALREIRDKKVSLLAGGDTRPELFQDVEAVNEHLGDSRATVTLFKQIEARNPVFAGSLYEVAEKSLIAAAEYRLARRYLGDAQERFAWAKQCYQRGLAYAAKNSEHADMARKASQENFAERVVRLITVLTQTGDQAQAREIQAEALRLCDSERIKNALGG
jgi:tetratricopeptide (TPR) repeat protein